MSAVKPELPRNEADLTRVLFPARHGKLPVTKETYFSFTMARVERHSAVEYLEEADGSEVPVLASCALLTKLPATSTSIFISSQFSSFFTTFTDYSELRLSHNLLLNCNYRRGYSFSSTTVSRSRPDTLCIASGRTLLVGEDKFQELWEAEQDLRNKVSQDQFILIDLEAVAEIPNELPPGVYLNSWSVGTLEGGFYTPMSDMHQLGQLLASKHEMVDTMPGQAFIQQLTAKQLSAELALQHSWLSNAKA